MTYFRYVLSCDIFLSNNLCLYILLYILNEKEVEENVIFHWDENLRTLQF